MRHKNAKPITVAELIEALRQEDQDRIIVLSRDPEGNGFSVLRSASAQSYKDGEIGLEKLDAEAKKAGVHRRGCDDGAEGSRSVAELTNVAARL